MDSPPVNDIGLPTMDILGTRVHLVQNPQVLEIIQSWIEAGPDHCRFVVNTGFHGLYVANEDPEFQKIANSADLFSPDGIATVWLAKLLGKDLPRRATSAELMQMYFEAANEKGYRSFFFGDTEETLQILKEKLEEKYTGHKVVGTCSPPFRKHTEEERQQMIDMINEAKPDVLWVGLGLPKQEHWIYQNRDKLNVPVAMGVGACFGFFSGKVRRVPHWVGESGFEWAWRFLAEPKKLWRRDMIDGPRFISKVVANWPNIKKANRQ